MKLIPFQTLSMGIYTLCLDTNGFNYSTNNRDTTFRLRFHWSFLFDDIRKLMVCKLPLDTIMDVNYNNYKYNKVLLANLDP